jgi:hypothetical protein
MLMMQDTAWMGEKLMEVALLSSLPRGHPVVRGDLVRAAALAIVSVVIVSI